MKPKCRIREVLLFTPKYLWIVLLGLAGPLIAQQAQLEFYPTGEHLSSSDPLKIRQDEDGFIWVMGQSLDRYDGYHFVNIKDQEAAWADFYLDDRNYIVLGNYIYTQSETHFFLRHMETGKLDSIYYRDQLKEGEIIKEDLFFHETASGRLFFFFYDPPTDQTTFVEWEGGTLKRRFSQTNMGTADAFDCSSSDCSSLLSDAEDHFYYLDQENHYLLKIDDRGQLLQKIPCPRPDDLITGLVKGKNRSLYLIYQNQIFQLQEKAAAFEWHPISRYFDTEAPAVFVRDILELPNGDLWACGTDLRLVFYQGSTGKVEDYHQDIFKLIPYRVSLLELMQDQIGAIWVRVQQLGLVKVIPQQPLFDTYFTEAACGGYCSFRGMVENETGQLFASLYHGIYQIDPVRKTTQKLIPYIDQYAPFGLGYDNGYLLLNSGLRFHSVTGELDNNLSMLPTYDSDEGVLVRDDAGNWWNGQENTLWFYDAKSEEPEWVKTVQMPVEGKIFSAHFGASSKRIWVGSLNRLFYYEPSTRTIAPYFATPEKEIIHAIFEDEKKNIWLGTEAGLVIIESRQQRAKKYTTKDGLPHDFVSSILPEGDSCLWLGTNSGLSRFQIKEETFTNFYTEHGLSHNEFNRVSAYKARSGQLFFGGMRGVNAFYPQEVMKKYEQQKKKLGKIILSSVTRTDEKLDTIFTNHLNLSGQRLEFHHWDKSITFEYCLTDYRKPEKTQFSYLLEGYSKVWSNPSKYNFAKFSTLPAGDYVLRVKAFDAKGSWNPNELAIPIKVYPPWWLTSWAFFLYALIVGGVFYGMYRLLRYRLELKSQFQFEQQEAQRLKDLDKFKSRLFTNLTHEFRTPLTIIMGMAKQILQGVQQVKEQDHLKTTIASQTHLIEQNGQSLLRLINQLLDLSKLENNAYQLNLQNEDVILFLNYAVSSFQPFANQQNLGLQFSSHLDSLKMDFDSSLLQQVMINLISNAIKFTASGGNILVKVNRLQKEEKELLQIWVQDSGIGIPAEKLPHVFDRFYQVESPKVKAGEGTGIGLAHTKELIQLMQGEIFVESTVGEGTTFGIHLPINNELEKSVSQAPPTTIDSKPSLFSTALTRTPINQSVAPPLSPHSPTLLIIEDNPDIVTYLKTCLSGSYRIEVAYNGKIGIEKALENIPDLIISDVMMPEKDGFEVCDFLKNNEKTSHIPIILLTAKADFTSKIEGLKRGADAYLPKPFEEEELKIRLQSLLHRQQRLLQYFAGRDRQLPGKRSEKTAALSNESLQIEDAFIQKIEAILEQHYADKDFGLVQLCRKVGMSRSQIFRKMKALTGISPSRFIRSYRLKKAKYLLENTPSNVSEAARETGFTSLPHFSRVFHEEFGVSPSATSN
ncbi:MAG: ATP-binding protein [Bacteroidota bacterium]